MRGLLTLYSLNWRQIISFILFVLSCTQGYCEGSQVAFPPVPNAITGSVSPCCRRPRGSARATRAARAPKVSRGAHLVSVPRACSSPAAPLCQQRGRTVGRRWRVRNIGVLISPGLQCSATPTVNVALNFPSLAPVLSFCFIVCCVCD